MPEAPTPLALITQHKEGSDAVSRDVDTSKKSLSDEDKLYLAQRGQLSTDVMSVEDQRKLLDPSNAGPHALELANTGTVATMTVEELEAALEQKRKEQEETDTEALFTNPPGLEGASADDDEERVSGDYDQYNKGQLSAEIAARNEEREDEEDYEPMALSGSKQELVDRLTEDDAERSDEE